MDDKASLVSAMKGSDTVFTVTNYWDKMDMKLEIQQGKNLADAAKETGVKHYIWSSLLNVTKRTLLSFFSSSRHRVTANIRLSDQRQTTPRLPLRLQGAR